MQRKSMHLKVNMQINGYIQESILYSILLKISHKGDKNYD